MIILITILIFRGLSCIQQCPFWSIPIQRSKSDGRQCPKIIFFGYHIDYIFEVDLDYSHHGYRYCSHSYYQPHYDADVVALLGGGSLCTGIRIGWSISRLFVADLKVGVVDSLHIGVVELDRGHIIKYTDYTPPPRILSGEGEAEEPSQADDEGCICVIDQCLVVLIDIGSSLGEGSGVSTQHIVSSGAVGVVEEYVQIQGPHSAIGIGANADEVVGSGDHCNVDVYIGGNVRSGKHASEEVHWVQLCVADRKQFIHLVRSASGRYSQITHLDKHACTFENVLEMMKTPVNYHTAMQLMDSLLILVALSLVAWIVAEVAVRLVTSLRKYMRDRLLSNLKSFRPQPKEGREEQVVIAKEKVKDRLDNVPLAFEYRYWVRASIFGERIMAWLAITFN